MSYQRQQKSKDLLKEAFSVFPQHLIECKLLFMLLLWLFFSVNVAVVENMSNNLIHLEATLVIRRLSIYGFDYPRPVK